MEQATKGKKGSASGGSGWSTVEKKPKAPKAVVNEATNGAGEKRNRSNKPPRGPPHHDSKQQSAGKQQSKERQPPRPNAKNPTPKKSTSTPKSSGSSSVSNVAASTPKSAPAPASTSTPTPTTATTTASTPSQTPVASAPTPSVTVSSWAQLFNSSASSSSAAPKSTPSASTPSPTSTQSAVQTTSAPISSLPKRASEPLASGALVDESKFVQLISTKENGKYSFDPRGLVNSGNLCFLNATLQALLSCEPFVNFLFNIYSKKLPAAMRTLESFLSFLEQYVHLSQKDKELILFNRTPINPTQLSSVVKEFSHLTSFASSSPYSSTQQKQEDAHEFFLYLLNKLHEELLDVSKQVIASRNKTTKEKSDVQIESWAEVGKKNKTNEVVEMEFIETPITRLFGTALRSVVRKKGSKPTVNVEPSLGISLDIDFPYINSLDDAFKRFMTPERLEGVTCSKTQLEVAASKQLTIEKLPRILIVQLKRFSYSLHATKIEKFVSFPKELNLSAFVSSTLKQSNQTHLYSLFAVITHHGKTLEAGHYTCDVLQKDGNWLSFNDHILEYVSAKEVASRQAYLLLYMRK